jgi:hypothetical protein
VRQILIAHQSHIQLMLLYERPETKVSSGIEYNVVRKKSIYCSTCYLCAATMFNSIFDPEIGGSTVDCTFLHLRKQWFSISPLCFCLAYTSTLKMEVICSPETLLNLQRTTWRHNSSMNICSFVRQCNTFTS